MNHVSRFGGQYLKRACKGYAIGMAGSTAVSMGYYFYSPMNITGSDMDIGLKMLLTPSALIISAGISPLWPYTGYNLVRYGEAFPHG